MAEFDILKNLPLLVFTLAFLIVFVIFIFGGFIILSAGREVEKTARGRKILLNSLYALFIILLGAFVFFSVTFLLRRGEALRPPEVPGEFPPSLAANFPPASQSIKIGEYYFNGPWPLKKNNLIGKHALYAILCQDLEEYDIIYLGQTSGREQLLKHSDYNCWLENCEGRLKNLYLAVFWAPSNKYTSLQRKEISNKLREETFPFCPEEI